MVGCNGVYKWRSKMEHTCMGIVVINLLITIHTRKLVLENFEATEANIYSQFGVG